MSADTRALLLAAAAEPTGDPGLLLQAGQGQGYQLVFADYARCILELGHGRYDAAYASFASGIDDTSRLKFALPDLVEAAQRSGRPAAAHGMVRLLTKLAIGNPGPGCDRRAGAARLGALRRGKDAVAQG